MANKKEMLAPFTPFPPMAKAAGAVLVVEIIAIFAAYAIAYAVMPNVIPTHFGLNGQPNGYSGKGLFVLPIALSIAPTLILVMSALRFKIINNYPYLINLPAFYINVSRIPMKERGFWVNKYFGALLMMGDVLGAGMFVMMLTAIYISFGAASRMLVWLPLVMIFLAVAIFLLYLRSYYLQMSEAARKAQRRR